MSPSPDPTHHLAQFNIALTRFPLDDPRMEGFTSMLDAINAIADASPGFVWRLVGEGRNNATDIRNPRLGDGLVNMSVWESRDALWTYVYRSEHLDFLRRRNDWFERPTDEHLVLWWIPAGHIPTVDEGIDRLERLRRDGPSADAFTFRRFIPTEASHAVV